MLDPQMCLNVPHSPSCKGRLLKQFQKKFFSVSSEVMASESDPIKLFSSNQSALYKAVDAVNQTEDNIHQQHQQQQQQQQQHQADNSTGKRILSNACKGTCESRKVLIV